MGATVQIEEGWRRALADEFVQPYWETLTSFVREEYGKGRVYPPPALVFNAFNSCPFERVQVVVIGQDPYHGPGQAHGLCFSVREGVQVPPSLQNIYKEIRDDIGSPVPASGNLERWAAQGVLLLNATLTVRAGQAGSHQGKGWEEFTDATIRAIVRERTQVVFLLWGSYARSKKDLIDPTKHLVLEAPHPSPLSAHRGFFGCKHFSKTNDWLRDHGCEPIRW